MGRTQTWYAVLIATGTISEIEVVAETAKTISTVSNRWVPKNGKYVRYFKSQAKALAYKGGLV